MKIAQWSTTARLSLGLVSVTLSLLLASGMLGLMPDQTKIALEARQKICEALAIQISVAAGSNDNETIQTMLTAVVERNDELLSAAFRVSGRRPVAVAGEHDENWDPPADGSSSPTHVRVPILNDREEFGVVELRFSPLLSGTGLARWKNSQIALLLFVALTGFAIYFVYLRRAFRELDPSSVIPERVKSAFDSLAEGVLIVDEKERIILANKAFGNLIERDPDDIAGLRASELGLTLSDADADAGSFPWQSAIKDGMVYTGVSLQRKASTGKTRTFIVNGAPILDDSGNTRGALATFDDVSDLERKNTELKYALEHLGKSREEVRRQNIELRFLATRDSLTGLLNRRALFDRFERLFKEARRDKVPLSAIMIDIDHFKSVNDHYGHAGGDKIIKFVAKEILTAARPEDLAARYGGEEFCIILPGLALGDATAVAEQLRMSVCEHFKQNFSSSRSLTISLGVASLDADVKSANNLVDLSDKALYAAKAGGRNRVVRWGDPGIETLGDRDGISDDQPDTDQSMLIQMSADAPQTLEMARLSERVTELDAMIEEKSMKLHQKHGFDKLTGLPNRILFYDRVTQSLNLAQRDEKTVAILYLDIDLVRRVDDVLGPVMGDELLKSTVDRLEAVLNSGITKTLLGEGSDSITISRLANNEFGIALYDLASTESVTWILQRLFDALSTPLEIENGEVYANCSVGIGLYPNDGKDVETLVRCASMARHHAHSALGRHKFQFYAEEMNQQSYEHILLEGQLREAIGRGEFKLYFQPEVDIRSGQVRSMEALIRWQHPEMGLIGPDKFIPIAEHSGFIIDLGDWVLRSACRQMKIWLTEGNDQIRVAVNLSALQIQSDKLVEGVLRILDEVGLDPKYLELEVTETAMIDNVGKIDRVLQKLRSKGIHIAIDDFGTGYSSLSHLKHLVVDKLKIDRSFIKDVTSNQTDAALVGAVIAMARRMKLCVVAEGVETQEQFDYLRSLKCDIAQGYYISKAVPAEEAAELLKSKVRTFKPRNSSRKRHPSVVTDIVEPGRESA
jgi:diguanylate cyclase (GGDEF)-like protein/PAS domain S-box-containing protein